MNTETYRNRTFILSLSIAFTMAASFAYASWDTSTVTEWLTDALTAFPVILMGCFGLIIIAALFINQIGFVGGDTLAWTVLVPFASPVVLFAWQSVILPTYIFSENVLRDQTVFIVASVCTACVLWILLALLVSFATGADRVRALAYTAFIASVLPFLMPMLILLNTMNEFLAFWILFAFSIQILVITLCVIWYLYDTIRNAQMAP